MITSEQLDKIINVLTRSAYMLYQLKEGELVATDMKIGEMFAELQLMRIELEQIRYDTVGTKADDKPKTLEDKILEYAKLGYECVPAKIAAYLYDNSDTIYGVDAITAKLLEMTINGQLEASHFNGDTQQNVGMYTSGSYYDVYRVCNPQGIEIMRYRSITDANNTANLLNRETADLRQQLAETQAKLAELKNLVNETIRDILEL